MVERVGSNGVRRGMGMGGLRGRRVVVERVGSNGLRRGIGWGGLRGE